MGVYVRCRNSDFHINNIIYNIVGNICDGVLRACKSWAFPPYRLHNNNNIIIHYETTDNSSEQLSRRLRDTTATEMEKYKYHNIILYFISDNSISRGAISVIRTCCGFTIALKIVQVNTV